MKRFIQATLALTLCSARLASAQSNSPAPSSIAMDAASSTDIRASQLENVAIRVATMKIQDGTARLHIGDTLSLSNVVVITYDSANAVIGRLRQFDATLRASQYVVFTAERQYMAVAEGSAEMILQYPRAAWFTRTDAPLIVHLRIDVVK